MKFVPLGALVAMALTSMSASAINSVNLADYRLVGRYSLPEPTRVTPPADHRAVRPAHRFTFELTVDRSSARLARREGTAGCSDYCWRYSRSYRCHIPTLSLSGRNA